MMGGMTVGQLCNDYPMLRSCLRDYWETLGARMTALREHVITHRYNGKTRWELVFELAPNSKIEKLNDLYSQEVIHFHRVEV